MADLTLFGANYGDHAGNAVSAGDVNKDGIDDLSSAQRASIPTGRHIPTLWKPAPAAPHLIYGQPDVWPASANLRDLNSGGDITGEINGFRLDGLDSGQAAAGTVADGDRAGHAVAAAGDVNGDGFADFIVGAPLARDGHYEGGEAYVVFGKAGAGQRRNGWSNSTAQMESASRASSASAWAWT